MSDVSTVFLCRDGPVARYVAHELAHGGLLDAIVVETGADARRRKLQREWKRTPWWRVPLLGLDLAALAVYGRLWQRHLLARLAGHAALDSYPRNLPMHRVDDANAAEAVERLSALSPTVMLVLGTSILREEVLSIPDDVSLNIHGGIVPGYRNVHSEVWAVLLDDLKNVGTAILHLDEGIDSGAVALQASVPEADGFFDLRWRNVVLSARLAREALHLHRAGALPRVPQPPEEAGFHRTPGFGALLRLALWGRRRVTRSGS